ncbi:prefoldin subunit 4-like [Artibeus jamaicensis]|uniref:prefoldin subunit 4-like n=1 Tax=Artibeus jamaicensis TaxID=9417 RepID=UPI00235AC928|nr:prefoldin subunit 4-like [Artibeus jamaicensis]
MVATMKKEAAEDVNVTFEDQQKINKFAQNTSRITVLKEEIDIKKKQVQNLEDSFKDIRLADDNCDDTLSNCEVFISRSQKETQEILGEEKKKFQREIDTLEPGFQRMLVDLKVQLICKIWKLHKP